MGKLASRGVCAGDRRADGAGCVGLSGAGQHATGEGLAATAGSPLSDAVGLYKELDDSRGGSGFSFNDLAANRSGTRFGEMAAASLGGAARLYRQADRSLREPDFFPDVGELPEYMNEMEFKRRYGGIGQPAYLKVLGEIERRIAALPLYRWATAQLTVPAQRPWG